MEKIGAHENPEISDMELHFVVNVELVNFGLNQNLGDFGVRTHIYHLKS